MKKSTHIHIGTSGWNYEHWRGAFYPQELAQKKWLDFYAHTFHTVEVNNSFYQLPEESTFENWRETAPEGFLFSIKASRYITHMKKLKEPQESLEKFMDRAKTLRNTLGPILFQLPPHWTFNGERLESFLNMLPQDFRYTFEFRDQSWWNQQVYDLLAKHNAAFCIYELAGKVTPKEITADFIYIRLHGPEEAYEGQYNSQTLSGWAGAFSAWRKQGKDIFCYFDNDQNGYAAQDAQRLQEMIHEI